MPRLAVIGAGLIGRSWAIVFARSGWEVALYDATAGAGEQALALVGDGLTDLKSHGLVKDPNAALKLVRVSSSLTDALDGATLVQENASETVDTKRAIFADLDRHAAPDTILASSTSTIVASKFTETLKGRQRCLVAHPVNPPHLVPIVELVGAPWTSPETIERVRAIYEEVGQVPIVVNREIEGFILNRLQAVLLSEAFRLVGEGYVSPQDLDKTLKDGLGLRWSFMGPFDTIELNAPGGIPDYCERYGPSLSRLSGADPDLYKGAYLSRILAAWGQMPTATRIAAGMAWRDKRLAALKAHKHSQPTR